MVNAGALITKAWLQLRPDNPLYNDQWISERDLASDDQETLFGLAIYNQIQSRRAQSLSISFRRIIWLVKHSGNLPHSIIHGMSVWWLQEASSVIYHRQVHNEPTSHPTSGMNVLDIHAKLIRMHNDRLILEPSEEEKRKNDDV